MSQLKKIKFELEVKNDESSIGVDYITYEATLEFRIGEDKFNYDIVEVKDEFGNDVSISPEIEKAIEDRIADIDIMDFECENGFDY